MSLLWCWSVAASNRCLQAQLLPLDLLRLPPSSHRGCRLDRHASGLAAAAGGHSAGLLCRAGPCPTRVAAVYRHPGAEGARPRVVDPGQVRAPRHDGSRVDFVHLATDLGADSGWGGAGCTSTGRRAAGEQGAGRRWQQVAPRQAARRGAPLPKAPAAARLPPRPPAPSRGVRLPSSPRPPVRACQPCSSTHATACTPLR